jgi:ATP-binding cassette subfamily C protein
VSLLPSFTAARRLLRQCEAAAQQPVAQPRPLPFSRSVTLEGVSFAYPGVDRSAVRDVTLTIRAGSTTGVAGPSGGGKTTIADLLLGLLEPGTGQVLVDGALLDAAGLESWRTQIGYVAQDTFLFHDTVRANLVWAQPDATDSQLWDALRMAAADSFVRALADGLETVLGDRGVLLSGGERQRLALARAFLRRPRLLILDEATSALDAGNEQIILSAIGALHGQMTVLLITHRLGVLKDADDIYVIDDGRVVESGRWNALREHPQGRLASLARAQGVD